MKLKQIIYLSTLCFLCCSAHAEILDLEVDLVPGPVNEKTMETGGEENIFNNQIVLARPYYMGHFFKRDGSFFIREIARGSGPGDEIRIKNSQDILPKMLDHDVIYIPNEPIPDWLGPKETTIRKLRVLTAPYRVPIFWCASDSQKISNTQMKQSFFFKMDETSYDRTMESFVEVEGLLTLYIYNHPEDVVGRDRFKSEYLTQTLTFSFRDVLDTSGKLATNFNFVPILNLEYAANLVRVNGIWRFIAQKNNLDYLKGIRRFGMYCLGAGGR